MSEKISIKEGNKKKNKKVKSKTLKTLVKVPQFKKYLQGINPYFSTLQDPFNVQGVRIPDIVTVPSSTFLIRDRRTLTWDATHLQTGIYYGGFPVVSAPTPMMGGLIPLQDTGAGTDSYAVGCTLLPANSNSVFVNTTATAMYFTNWSTPGSAVQSFYSHVRLVSAALSVRFTGNSLNNQGKMTAVFVPKNFLKDYYRTNTIPLDFMSQIPGALVVPVNAEDGITIFYRPADNQVMEYQSLDVQTTRTSAVYTPQQATPGGLFFMADGLSSTVGSFQTVFVANYEAIPRTTSFGLVGVSNSISDPISLSHAMNEIQKCPTAIGSCREAEHKAAASPTRPSTGFAGESGSNTTTLPGSNSSSPSSHQITESHPGQKESMFERVIGEILPIVKEGAPIVKDILSVLK